MFHFLSVNPTHVITSCGLAIAEFKPAGAPAGYGMFATADIDLAKSLAALGQANGISLAPGSPDPDAPPAPPAGQPAPAGDPTADQTPPAGQPATAGDPTADQTPPAGQPATAGDPTADQTPPAGQPATADQTTGDSGAGQTPAVTPGRARK